jgi:hypothetical protein
MKLGIMQPYFFPYLGYFDLINYADRWIVFDNVQYIRHGWINRNRVLHPTGGWSYIIVPVKYSRSSVIREVSIAEDGKWKKRIRGQLEHYKKKAPYYHETMSLIEDCLAFEGTLISRLNVFVLERLCAYLGIDFNYTFLSEMKLELDPVQNPGDWALRISQALGAREYINPPGGASLFDKKKFAERDIKLTIRNLRTFTYICTGHEFIPNLSIIDLLMWNEPGKIKNYLDEITTDSPLNTDN